ncbi:hypothetical protein GCM10027271_15790 [Saccharopolyspora gloriosae]
MEAPPVRAAPTVPPPDPVRDLRRRSVREQCLIVIGDRAAGERDMITGRGTGPIGWRS